MKNDNQTIVTNNECEQDFKETRLPLSLRAVGLSKTKTKTKTKTKKRQDKTRHGST